MPQQASLTLKLGSGKKVPLGQHFFMHFRNDDTGVAGWFCGKCRRRWVRKPWRGVCKGGANGS